MKTIDKLLNVYSPDESRVWLRLVPGAIDLEIEELDVDSHGEKPEWLENELSECGWEGIFHDLVPYSGGFGSWNSFALEEGLAPFQPFLTEIGAPEYFQCGSFDERETDVRWPVDVIDKVQYSAKQAALRWSRWTAERTANKKAIEKEREAERLLQRSDVSSMYLTYQVYFTPGGSYYDDMAMPGGVRAYLCSQASLRKPSYGICHLTSGEDHRGSHEVAKQKLWERVQADGFPLTEQQFKALKTRSY